jgi:WD40 repeat protein/predicted Ser/Thr protein kinase
VQRIGDYELLEEIARGGMGVVYRARQLSLNRTVALKVILSGHLASKEEVSRFRLEAEAAANLHHPSIVTVYETGEEDGRHYFSMEYVSGQDLGAVVRQGPMPARRAALCAQRIAEAVHYAHQQGTLHRDLKPSNVLLDPDDRPRITDFGLAKRLRDGASPFAGSGITVTGQVLGSPSFMPPEQATGKPDALSPASDVYSVGAILYHLVTGRPPFQAVTLPGILRAVAESEPIAPRLLQPDLPRDLEIICLRCLEKDPAKRYGSAQDLADDLGRFLRGEPIRARPLGAVGKLWRWCRRQRSLAASLAAIGLLLLTVIVGGLVIGLRLRRTTERLRHRNYAGDIGLAYAAYLEKNYSRLETLIRQQVPQADEPDLRGFEWGFLNKLCEGMEEASIEAHDSDVCCLAPSPDGRWLLTLGMDGRIKLWDARTRSLQRIVGTTAPMATVTAADIAFSADTRLAAAADGSAIRVWETAGWTERKVLAEGSQSLAFVPGNGGLIAACGRRVLRWDCDSWSVRTVCEAGQGELFVSRIACSPDGKLLAVAQGKSMRLLDPRTGESIAQLPERLQTFAYAMVFSPDSRYVAVGGMLGEVMVWDVVERRLEARFGSHRFFAAGLAFSPDGRFLASGGSDQFIEVREVNGSSRWRKVSELTGHRHQISRLAFAPDSRLLISASRDHTVKFWNPEKGRNAGLLEANAAIGFTAGGDRILTLDTNAAVRLWDVASQRELRVLKSADRRMASNAEMSHDGHKLAIAYRDGTVEIRSSRDAALLQTLSIGNSNNVRFVSVRFSPDSSLLAVAIDEVTATCPGFALWDLSTGERLPWSGSIQPSVRGVAFSHRGSALALGTADGRLSVWDYRRGRLLYEIKAHSSWITGVTFSPDDQILATGSADTTARLWDAVSGRPVGTPLAGQTISVVFLCFSPDGRTLVTAGGDNTLTLWHVASQQETLSLRWDGNFLGQPVFSPDGTTLAAGALLFDNPGGRVQLWRGSSRPVLKADASSGDGPAAQRRSDFPVQPASL